ncbi:MAG: phospholipid carrier-dependent glycosyltransferase [Ignavibacteriae bacterium]|nr:MAG: phospholipid carrier-dependent glycosyltransferase [Ignavibacteriota bacterium]
MSAQRNIKRKFLYLIIFSFIIRLILASVLELSNDEASYRLYALYPALSHFDHPPMVGFFIQLFSLDLILNSELFIRLSSVLFGTVNTWLIFITGKKIKDERTGFYAAILYTASLYFFIITGVFIQPDTPMVFFWLITIFLFTEIFLKNEKTRKQRTFLLLAGLSIGLGMLSKYHSVYLWASIGAYILLYDRHWLKVKELYLAVLISVICFIPVIIWNIQNDFISFTFQSERIDVFKSGLQFNYFFQELSGQIFYNNPVNFIIILIALINIRKIKYLEKNKMRLLILTGLPLILMFLLFSLFRNTLPHWSGPGYITLIILASAYLSNLYEKKSSLIPLSNKISLSVLILIIVFGVVEINFGIIPLSGESNAKPTELGKNDVTLDMYGWKQAGEKFKQINDREVKTGNISPNAQLFAHKWYNASHIDYYMAEPVNKITFALGRLDEIRNLNRINKKRGDITIVQEGYYISPSRDFKDPNEVCGSLFRTIVPIDTIRIERSGKIAENIFVYRLKK